MIIRELKKIIVIRKFVVRKSETRKLEIRRNRKCQNLGGPVTILESGEIRKPEMRKPAGQKWENRSERVIDIEEEPFKATLSYGITQKRMFVYMCIGRPDIFLF